ncbi:MAG: DedA family protein [Elusimicrobia bacterium]|nr:DedA family protein [Elusimicrobiota bacterium]
MFEAIVEVLLHGDQYLNVFVNHYGFWSYVILFLIIFIETGLVVMPFLPGDSLLFAVGALAAAGTLDVVWIITILSFAGIMGDSVNYAVGKYCGNRILNTTLGRFIKKDHLERTHSFFEKFGGKTIVLARFVPIIRTLAPFVAGIGKMSYPKFAVYNILGGILWVASLILAGYFFGTIGIVKENFALVILGIIFISLLPGIIEYARHILSKKAAKMQCRSVSDAIE